MHGILIIDKPEGGTSHDIVNAIRKKFNTAKVGHLGTLDPMATGVLPIAIGKATRLAQFISSSPKIYEGELRFGFSTNTYDRTGSPTSEEKTVQYSEGDIRGAVQTFTGSIDQTPPSFSAKKIGSVPSYKFARKNRPVDLPAATVHIESFEIVSLNLPYLSFRIVCSPGTYIRSLAHDLGRQLGCGAHLTRLRRMRSGDFTIADAVSPDACSAANLLPLEALLVSLPRIEVCGPDETKVLHGNQIPGDGNTPLTRIFNKKGEFLAVASVENGWVRPKLVLT
ncbi:MAG TPA: tRNA pseudouridine(55) synthase TruB [Terriglobia bacterium]|jgi:tRNA pseudouridine55 synthase